jgi:hypothetical protein
LEQTLIEGINKFLLAVLNDPSVVPGPTSGEALDCEQLRPPWVRVWIAASLAHDEQVEVALGGGFAARDRSEQQGELWRLCPRPDRGPQLVDQLRAQIRESLDVRCREVLSVQSVKMGRARCSTPDASLRYQSVGSASDTLWATPADMSRELSSCQLDVGASECGEYVAV